MCGIWEVGPRKWPVISHAPEIPDPSHFPLPFPGTGGARGAVVLAEAASIAAAELGAKAASSAM